MSLSIKDSNGAHPLAVIRGNDDKKLSGEVVYVSEEAQKGGELSMELHGDMRFQVLPDPELERTISFVAGRSGSGKSHYTGALLKEYKKIYVDNPIYVFSMKKSDPALDKLGVERIMIDQSLIDDPLKLEDFEDSMLVFDDIDVLEGKLRKAVYNIMEQGLEIGRSMHVSMIVTNHLLTNGKDTRRLLNEAQYISFFPAMGSFYGINYLLSRYLGCSKAQIQKIKHLKSRWVTIRNCCPTLVICQNECYLLSKDD